jgi:tyrosinase
MGGVVSDVAASPSDPIFYMHHAFVDRAYAAWQAANPTRLTTINGQDANRVALTLSTLLSVRGIRPNVTIGDVLNTMSGAEIGGVPFCYRYDR